LKSRTNFIQISCDGGAATGKSTGAKLIARKYRLKFLSSGLLYRYASLLILKNNPKKKISFLKKNFKNLNYKKIEKLKMHSQEISNYTSVIAKQSEIRKILKKFQVEFAKKNKNCCIEGRDISINILPKSDLKFFFKCNLNIASYRRYKELKKENLNIKLKDVKKALRIRNLSDTKRKNSPLLRHQDSIEIDTGKLDKTKMLSKMSVEVEKILKKKYGNRTRSKRK